MQHRKASQSIDRTSDLTFLFGSIEHMDVYGSHLQSICDILQHAGLTPVVRGEGTARFVYAENTDRAVELYWDGVGFALECFLEPTQVSVRDYQKDSATIAAEQAVEFLLDSERH